MGHDPGLVVCCQCADPVANAPGHALCVFHKMMNCFPVGPAPSLLQSIWQVPVVQGHRWAHVVGQKSVNQAVIKIQALGVPSTLSKRLNAWPRNGETVGINAQAMNHFHIVLPTMVMVASNQAMTGISDDMGLLAKAIPNGGAFSIELRAAFNLKGAGGDTPNKIRRKILRHRRNLQVSHGWRALAGFVKIIL